MSRATRPPQTTQTMPVGAGLVLSGPEDQQPLSREQRVCPAVLCGGFDSRLEAVDGLVAAAGGVIWVMRWADGAELACCAPVGTVPEFLELRTLLEAKVSADLRLMPTANRLPA